MGWRTASGAREKRGHENEGPLRTSLGPGGSFRRVRTCVERHNAQQVGTEKGLITVKQFERLNVGDRNG